MPFPYTFPFYFDVILVKSDTGSGIDAVVSRLLGATEAGSGQEATALIAVLIGSDEGSGCDALKALIETAGSGVRLLDHAGQVGMPSKGVKL